MCKRDGVTLDAPEPAEGDAWQKLMVYGSHARSTSSSCAGCARAGAAGATTLRGVWGYHGDTRPHGESALAAAPARAGA